MKYGRSELLRTRVNAPGRRVPGRRLPSIRGTFCRPPGERACGEELPVATAVEALTGYRVLPGTAEGAPLLTARCSTATVAVA